METVSRSHDSEMVKMANDHSDAFVTLYIESDILYNTSLKDYRNKDRRRAAIRRIAEACHLQESDVKKKISSLRTIFSREQKKEKSSWRNGASVDDVYVPCWRHYTMLKPHLAPYVVTRPSKSDCDDQEESQLEHVGGVIDDDNNNIGLFMSCVEPASSSNTYPIQSLTSAQMCVANYTSISTPSHPSSPNSLPSDNATPSAVYSHNSAHKTSTPNRSDKFAQINRCTHLLRKRKRDFDSKISNALQKLTYYPSPSSMPYYHWAVSVATELSNLKSKKLQIQTKMKIDTLISEACLEDLDFSSGSPKF